MKIFVLSLLLAAQTFAMTDFGEQRVITDVEGVQDIDVADFDNDGDLDILAALDAENRVVWYENIDGLGTFGPALTISTDMNDPSITHAADLDGDGDFDVLAASYTNSQLAWYENTDGLGTFGPQQIISTNVEAIMQVVLEDLDGDEDIDILFLLMYTDGIFWFENMDGRGTYGSQQSVTASISMSFDLCAADMDGDGDVDVLCGSGGDGTIYWYANTDGQGTFGPPQVVDDELAGPYAADLDGDGDNDILVRYSVENKIAWYENSDGMGTFGEQRVIDTDMLKTRECHINDIDKDGDPDIFVALQDADKIVWYENTDGLGTFGPQQEIITGTDGTDRVLTADLNGDGYPDVLHSSWRDGVIAWFENLSSEHYFTEEIVITTDADGALDVHTADLDGDGDPDVLAASLTDDKVTWYENTDGKGTFGDQQVITTNVDGLAAIDAADLDGDGDLDVLSVSFLDDKIAWYANNGMGIFGSQQLIGPSPNVGEDILAADLDGDGDQDILSVSITEDRISWYENTDGQGFFGSLHTITTGADGATNVHAADLDNDGDLDVLSASMFDDRIAWYENDSTGSFGDQQIISTIAYGANSVYAADIDGDGDLDVLSAFEDVLSVSQGESIIAWYENSGGGSFGPQQIITANTDGANSVYAADLDRDGDLDALSASSKDNMIAWYENTDGQGTFGGANVINNNADGAIDVHAADLDDDGDLDVLSASIRDDKIAWYENMLPLPPPVTVIFTDNNLELLIREVLGKMSGDINSDDMKKITELDGSNRGISNLTGLEHAVNLEKIKVKNNMPPGGNRSSVISATDEMVLEQMNESSKTMLKGIEKEAIQHRNLTFLYDTMMKGHKATYGTISDLSALSNLYALESVDLSYNEISDISPLENLENLVGLDLFINEINDITVVANLINLSILDLSFNQIENITPLAGLLKLERLYLGSNQIKDISVFENLVNLHTLWLSYNEEINQFLPISFLTKLKGLYLRRAGLEDIGFLSELNDLTKLYITENEISDFSPISQLKKMENLSIEKNQLDDDGLVYLYELDSLDNQSVYTFGFGYGYLDLRDNNPLSELSVQNLAAELPNFDYDEILFDEETSIDNDNMVLKIEKFQMFPNHPNPFNPTTNILFTVPIRSLVQVSVYDITGRLIKELVNDNYETGMYSIPFDASDLTSGVYFIKFSANDYLRVQKCTFVK